MENQNNKVENYLKSNGIDFIKHEHREVFTCEDVEKYCPDIPGLSCKNLFLRNQKKKRYFLLVLPADKQTDLKKFAELAGDKKLSFGSADDLMEKLSLKPGSVSPFGLINDSEGVIELFIDKEVFDADIVSFHPNHNSASLELTKEMFHKFLGTLKNEYTVIGL
jgi:Ala-tRNA(Pro) deacylase